MQTEQNDSSQNKHHDVRIPGKKGFYMGIIKKFFSDSDYLFLLGKLIKIKVFKKKTFLFAICDINNICNLKCKHCYWWLNRDGETNELTINDWKQIITEQIKKNHILQVNVVGGEPVLRPDVIKLFNEELPGKFTIVTNGTIKLVDYEGLVSYWISIDGMKEIHDKIRGESFDKIEKNVRNYIKSTGKKVWISMTINTWNCDEIVQVANYWKELAESISFQFHTPFMKDEPLWIPYGDKKNKILDIILELKKKFPDYVINEVKQLNLMRNPWGGDKTGPTNCPNWAILTLDHTGAKKTPCCLGSSGENDLKPLCENCGMSNYSSLFVRGIHL